MNEGREPHALVAHRQDDGGWTWDCEACGKSVYQQVDGGSMFWLTKAQTEHECPNDVARALLPHHLKKIKKLLDELEVSIEVDWTEYEAVELVLMDRRTKVELRLGTEELK